MGRRRQGEERSSEGKSGKITGGGRRGEREDEDGILGLGEGRVK